MRTFREVKKYMSKELSNNRIEISMGKLRFQIYQNPTLQFNAAFGADTAVIKFEERKKDIFTVAVQPVGENTIVYSYSKEFTMDDNIVELISTFPEGDRIDEVVACLLSFKDAF